MSAVPTPFDAYCGALRRHALRTIAEGYSRMVPTEYATEQEPAITGDLVANMRAFLESGESAPSWAAFYSVHDDPPLNVEGRKGKRRPRVDFEVERVASGKRPRLRFEAKRLSSSTGHTVSAYLGNDGLGCFLTGRYPLTHGEAGMLGYVQSDDAPSWAERIGTALAHDADRYAVDTPAFAQADKAGCPRYSYSSHHYATSGQKLSVYHVLLCFLPV